MFHLSTKPIKRSAGRTATASSAYRNACEITDERTGLKHDYTKKQGVVSSECFIIENNQRLEIDRGELWNLAEKTEKRKDARTAREILVNLPHELSKSERKNLVDDFTNSVAKKYGVAVDYAIHLPDKQGDQRNHHCHIMITTRTANIENGKLSLNEKSSLELSNKKLADLKLPKTQEQIKSLRAEWSETANRHLENAGLEQRIDHRSFAERGIDLKPTIKMGKTASEMERRGISTIKGDLNRQIKADNEQIQTLENSIYIDKGRLSARKELDDKREQEKTNLLDSLRQKYKKDDEPNITDKYQQWKAEREQERLAKEQQALEQQRRAEIAQKLAEEQQRLEQQRQQELARQKERETEKPKYKPPSLGR